HALTLLAKRPEVSFFSDVTTNGYLLSPHVFSRLLDLRVTTFQVSVDGPKTSHDRRRVLINGRGTFDRIWTNLLGIRELPGQFHVTVRVHADRENEASIPAFLDDYRVAFGQDPRFRLFIREVSRLGGPNDHLLPTLEGQEIGRVVETLRARA